MHKLQFQLGTHSISGYMMGIWICILSNSSIASASSLSVLYDEAAFHGQIRSYFQPRRLDTVPDQTLYGLGGNLKLETGVLHGFQLGTALFISTDFGLNRESLRSANPILPVSEILIFAEAYLRYNNFDTDIKVGRQQIETPFMNAADSLLFPVTFLGYSLSNKSIKNVEFFAAHVTDVKIRQNDFFEDTDQFITRQLGIPIFESAGTTVFGVKWKNETLSLEGWNYIFPELYDMVYFEGDVSLPEIMEVQPRLGIQAGQQFDIGDSRVGKMNATVIGANLRLKRDPITISYAFNYIPRKEG